MSDGKVIFDITGNTSGISSALNSATSSIAQQTAKWTVLGQTAMNALVSAAKAGFNAIKDLAMNGFEYNAQMETYTVNFKTLLGSAEAAQTKIAELTEYAAKTPFALSDLADATQTMLSFGLTSEEASVALKHIGDISLGDASKLSSLTLAFSQVSSAGKLAGQDLLQMINAGFNPLKIIAEETGVAYADLKAVMSGEKTSDDFNLRMEAARKEVAELGVNASESAIMLAQIGEDGMISADMVAAAMRLATSEGGAFYKALENASETAKGQISTLQDGWDMLIGKVTGGAFDSLSTTVLPKLISWVDELNSAFDEKGFDGLKDAAGGIFSELGTLAFNAGSGLLAEIYNGLTGDTKSSEDIKGFLTEIFGAASDTVENLKNAGTEFLKWVEEHGELVGAAATAIGIGFGVFALMSNPLPAILAALAGALVLFTTDWDTFEEKCPDIVSAFESLTGIEFDDFVSGVASAKENLTSFWNDVLAPLFTWLSENGAAAQGILFGIGAAMAFMGQPVAGIALMAGVIIANWNDIKAAVEGAVASVSTFFTQTIPDAWNEFVDDIKQSWEDNVSTPIGNAKASVENFFKQTVPDTWNKFCDDVSKAWTDTVAPAIDGAALKAAELLGLEVPANWSLTKTLGEAFDTLLDKVASVIESIKSLFHLGSTGSLPTYDGRYDGKYAGYGDDWTWELQYYAQQAIKKGTQNGVNTIDWDLRPSRFTDADWDAFRFDLSQAMSNYNLTVEDIEAWFGDPETDLQSQLDQINLTARINGLLTGIDFSFGSAGSAVSGAMAGVLSGVMGLSHAAGGLFTSATRFLGEDGMHTFGESGTEVLLPLDALWSKMGMIFDQSLSSNLASMQFSVMPALPAADPTGGFDDEKLGETISASIREAMANWSVDLDRKKVGKLVAKDVSHEIAHETNGRKWTS